MNTGKEHRTLACHGQTDTQGHNIYCASIAAHV